MKTAIVLARPAPATPSAYPVPQPVIRTGASAILMMTGGPQRGRHHLRDELQRQRRHEPEKIGGAGIDGGLIGGNRAHIRARQRKAAEQRQQPEQHRQNDRLVEHQIGVVAILAAHGMRDQRHRADAEHLHQRVDEESSVAGRSDAGHGRIAEPGHEVQVDQLADHDRDHADHDRWRHVQDMAHDGAARQVLHLIPSLTT
jgi:hypothetical protein